MFIKNDTRFAPTLRRGHVGEHLALAVVSVRCSWRVADDGSLEPVEEEAPTASDPPDVRGHVLWIGTSVTVSGLVHGPERPPYEQAVSLRVGDASRVVVVSGDRVWERGGADLIPSQPAPFDSMELSFARAFGGGYTVPPGPDPVTGLPSPGARVLYPLNPHGVGFYRDSASALGQPLPNIERADQRVRSWSDRPEPAGYSPCQQLVTLRAPSEMRDVGTPVAEHGSDEVALWLLHHAPPGLIFKHLPAGTPVELSGCARVAIRFRLPSSPIEVTAKPLLRDSEPPWSMRAVHLNAESRVLSVTFSHGMKYRPSRAPRRAIVAHASRR